MMKLGIPAKVTSIAAAVVVMFQISLAASGDQNARAADRDRDGRSVEIIFTKWVTDFSEAPYPMRGVVWGDVDGDFVGDALDFKFSQRLEITGIEAVYGVEAGRYSFTALIKGGENARNGSAILDGVILRGWRRGAPVHVEYRTIRDCNIPGAAEPACYHGTIRVGSVPK